MSATEWYCPPASRSPPEPSACAEAPNCSGGEDTSGSGGTPPQAASNPHRNISVEVSLNLVCMGPFSSGAGVTATVGGESVAEGQIVLSVARVAPGAGEQIDQSA